MGTNFLSNKSNVLIQTFENVATLVGERTEVDGQPVGMNLLKEKATCKDSAQQLRNGIFKVLVMGRYDTGKSTFINALIQSHFLPESMRPCTSILTFVQYGETPGCKLHYKRTQTNGVLNEEYVEELSVKEFFETYQYTADDDQEFKETGMVQRFDKINYAVVKTDSPLLKGGVQVIDSPGLYNNEMDNTLSLKAAEDANAILYLCGDAQYDMHDRLYFDKHFCNCPVNVFFIVNKYDLCKTEQDRTVVKQKVEDDIAKYFYDEDGHFHKELMEKRVFYVSSLYAQYGLGMITSKKDDFGNDHMISEEERNQYYSMSGFGVLEDGLSDFLQTDIRLEAAWKSYFKRLSGVYGKITQKIADDDALYQNNLLTDERVRNEYKEKIRNLKLQIGQLEAKVDTGTVKTQQLFSDIITSAVNDLDKSWEDDVLSVSKEVDFSFVDYLRLVLKNINIFRNKGTRTEEINQMLTPFANAVARHFILRIDYNAQKQSPVIEDVLNALFVDIYSDANSIKDQYDEFVCLINTSPLVSPGDIHTTPFDGVNGSLARNLISLYLGDISQLAKDASGKSSLLDFIKRTIVNTLWQATIAALAGGAAAPIIIAIEAWQMSRNKNEFVTNTLNKIKYDMLNGLRENLQRMIEDRNVLVAEFMDNVKGDCCGEYKTALWEKEDQLDELEHNIANDSFNYQTERGICLHVKDNILNAIQSAYKQIAEKDISEEQVLSM